MKAVFWLLAAGALLSAAMAATLSRAADPADEDKGPARLANPEGTR